MSEKQEWITPNAFAEVVSVSPRAVLNGVQTGRFSDACLKTVQTKSGKTRYKIELHQGQVEWDANRGGHVPITDAEAMQWRRRKEQAEAEILEIKRDELAGLLVRASDVQAAHAKIGRQFRDGLLNSVILLAPQFVAMDNVKDIEGEMNKAFTELLEGFTSAARGGELTK